MIDVLGAQSLAREFREEKILFVGGVVRPDDAEFPAAHFDFVRSGPPTISSAFDQEIGSKPFARAQHGRLQAFRMLDEIESVAALDAQKFAVDAAAVAIVAANDLVVADAQRGAAAVGAMRADGADVLHFPGPRLITINAAGERAHRTDVDAGAALVAFQMIVMVGNDLGDHAAVGHAQRLHAHAFIADPHAAVAQNAARRVEEHHRRPLLFVGVDLALDEAAFARSVAEHHVLQFALAALVAHRAIQRMIGQQELERPLARDCRTTGDSVWTTMPSATGSVQPTCSLGVFSTSTRHMRQAACRVSPS